MSRVTGALLDSQKQLNLGFHLLYGDPTAGYKVSRISEQILSIRFSSVAWFSASRSDEDKDARKGLSIESVGQRFPRARFLFADERGRTRI